MGSAAKSVEGDWLDDHCWRCGSEEVEAGSDGRVLCAPCRRAEFGPVNQSLALGGQLSWDGALDRCWRCMARAVDPADDLGLCDRCRRSHRGSANSSSIRRSDSMKSPG